MSIKKLFSFKMLPNTRLTLSTSSHLATISLQCFKLDCILTILPSSLSPDIDECAEGTDDCGENAFCDNLIGSYRCICNKGFRGDGKECVRKLTCLFGVRTSLDHNDYLHVFVLLCFGDNGARQCNVSHL